SLAAGTPVVASRRTPWQELDRIGCGRWVEPEPEILADAVLDVLNRGAAEMGRRGRSFVFATKTAERMADEMRTLDRTACASWIDESLEQVDLHREFLWRAPHGGSRPSRRLRALAAFLRVERQGAAAVGHEGLHLLHPPLGARLAVLPQPDGGVANPSA